ncbi:site-specific integrase [Streptosporangium sp. NPDC005286]|uniref:site-specific integrase n=1 Tax=Streptosporangium sp. NPDC005286 TaxID=3154463 RepID=UPI0033BF1F6C
MRRSVRGIVDRPWVQSGDHRERHRAAGADPGRAGPSSLGSHPRRLGKLHVRFGKGANTSGPRPRWVPMLDGLDLVLRWFLNDVRGRFPDSPVLFADESGGALHRGTIRNRLRYLMQLEGRPKEEWFSPHALRRACATHNYERGVDLVAIQQLRRRRGPFHAPAVIEHGEPRWASGNATVWTAAVRSASSAASTAVVAWADSRTRPPRRPARPAASSGCCRPTPADASRVRASASSAGIRSAHRMRRCAATAPARRVSGRLSSRVRAAAARAICAKPLAGAGPAHVPAR